MAFLTERFPTEISWGSTGGPGYKTRIIETASGYEFRNQNWARTKHKYNAATGIRNAADLDSLVAFFHLAAGRANSFRYKDWSDYKTCATNVDVGATDQIIIESAVGGENDIQLVKTYTVGTISVNREIVLPVEGTASITLNSVLLTETTDYTIDYDTGILTLSSALSPGDLLEGGYEFDVLCRFDADELILSLESYRVSSATVPIVETRELPDE
jgi:uncharacterized protein (TIGR02217 family)